jgi:hypothetical protein
VACVRTTTQNQNALPGSIKELLVRIDEMQKEAVTLANANGCNTCAFVPAYNTKPIAVYTCNGFLTVPVTPGEAETASYFRVENVKNDETVILRLLTEADGVFTCTTNTITIRISCICGIQCFGSINCQLCGDA